MFSRLLAVLIAASLAASCVQPVRADFTANPASTPAAFPSGFSNTGDVVLTSNPGVIRSNTSDTTDNKAVRLSGGGAFGVNRGAQIEMSGNEATNPGDLFIEAGTVTGGDVRFTTNGVTDRLVVKEAGGVNISDTGNAGGNVPHACAIESSTSGAGAENQDETCGTGTDKIAVGGGCAASASTAIFNGGFPLSPTTWRCQYSTPGVETITAYVVCCTY
jgi:hypothetical protein